MSGERWQGLLLLDKPSGPTSHDIVYAVRRSTGQKRIGHAGTLDPLASGLLPLVLGRATRLVRFLPAAPKVYEGAFRLGITSDTDDVAGDVQPTDVSEFPDPVRVVAVAREFLGVQLQRPPAYSARKVGGRRMYDLARRGLAAEAEPREVDVTRFEPQPSDRPDLFRFEAEVSTGTYIRALVRDLGQRLGCGAALESLRRTRIGPMSLDDSLAVPAGNDVAAQERLAAGLIPPGRMPLTPRATRLGDPEDSRRFVTGGLIRLEDGFPEDGPVRVLDPSGALLGIGEVGGGLLKPCVVIADSPAPRSRSDRAGEPPSIG